MSTNASARNFDLNIEKILEGWETHHAIREIIANALDEQILSGTRDVEISSDPNGIWHVRDWGRGLRYEYLTQNENQEKLSQPNRVIGKFGVGLKDALATLNRRGIDVRIISRHCEISLLKASKHGFSDVVTLQAAVAPPGDLQFTGTDISLSGVSFEEIEAARAFFMKFSNEEILDETPYGQILRRNPATAARIYVTGILVAEEERFAFSYNITSLTSPMRKALNRERTNVGRTAYSDRVKSMLLASKAEAVACVLTQDLTGIERGANHDEVLWTDVAVHACQILNSSRKVVFVTAAELVSARDSIDHAVSDGHQIVTVPDNIRRPLAGLNDLDGNPVRSLSLAQREWSESFEFKFVEPSDLSVSERQIFSARDRIVVLAGGLPASVREIKVSESMRPDALGGVDPRGLWEPSRGRIIIKRSELSSLARFAGTLLHELTHACTGFADVSREFETALTELMGRVASETVVARTETHVIEKPQKGSSVWRRFFG